MDLLSLPAGGGHSLNCAGHQLSSADSLPSVSVTMSSECGSPGKAIGRRCCVVDQDADSDSEYYDASPDVGCSDENYFDALDCLPADCQKGLEEETDAGDGSWQVVTRRKPKGRQRGFSSRAERNKVQKHKNAQAKKTSAGQCPDRPATKRSAPHSVSQPLSGKESLLPMSSALTPYWSICVECFELLAKISWQSFRYDLLKFQERAQIDQHQRVNISRDDFLRFQQMMIQGAKAGVAAEDVVFLVDPFKVLLCQPVLSPKIIFLSLLFQRTVPDFVQMLGEPFIRGLTGVKPGQAPTYAATSELFVQIGQHHDCDLDQLGWPLLRLRLQCKLFSFLAFIFKQQGRLDLIRQLNQQIDWPWLEDCFLTTVGRDGNDPVAHLLDLREVIRAAFFWLENQFFVLAEEEGNGSELIDSFASICELLLEVVGDFEPLLESLRISVWRAVCQWSVHFGNHFSRHLGYDRAIRLLEGLLHVIQRMSELDRLAFELRLRLMEVVLMKCEDLLPKRDGGLFTQAWREFRGRLAALMASCNEFLQNYQHPFTAASQLSRDKRRASAQLDLQLRESAFYRLDFARSRSSRQQIQEKLLAFRQIFADGWSLSKRHAEIGTSELAKWYFLANQHQSGIKCLKDAHFELDSMRWKKADLLDRYGDYQAAIDEYRHGKALLSDRSAFSRHLRDVFDDRIAMTLLHWYEAGNNIDHLIEAYRLDVDLLGRCSADDRERFEGVLNRVVNAMKASGLKFADYSREAAVLSYLVNDGGSLKSWHHFADVLHIRHKLGLTNAGTINRVAREIGGKYRFFLELGKKS